MRDDLAESCTNQGEDSDTISADVASAVHCTVLEYVGVALSIVVRMNFSQDLSVAKINETF